MKHAFNMKLDSQKVVPRRRRWWEWDGVFGSHRLASWSVWQRIFGCAFTFTLGSLAIVLNDERGYFTPMGLAAIILNFMVSGLCLGELISVATIRAHKRLIDNLFRMNSAIIRKLHGE